MTLTIWLSWGLASDPAALVGLLLVGGFLAYGTAVVVEPISEARPPAGPILSAGPNDR